MPLQDWKKICRTTRRQRPGIRRSLLVPITCVLCVCCSVVVSQTCLAEDRGMSGHVYDRNGPVFGAEVKLSYGTEVLWAASQQDGHFTFDIRPPADAILQVQSVDHKAVRLRFETFLQQGNKTELALKDKTIQRDEIIVVGKRISSDYAISSLEKLSIYADPAAQADPLLAVNALAVSTNPEESAAPELRGSPRGRNRIFLNDVPLYETVKGSSIDRSLESVSLVPTSMLERVEVYPSHPPLYLTNTSGGAVRLLSDHISQNLSTLFVGTTGLGMTHEHAFKDNSDQFAKIFANFTDMSLMTALNPAIRDTLKTYRTFDTGMTLKTPLKNDTGDIRYFGFVSREKGRYPLYLFTLQDEYRGEKSKTYHIVNLNYSRANFRIKLDGSYAQTFNREAFGVLHVKNKNRYVYANLDLGGNFFSDHLSYRLGVSFEDIVLKSLGVGPNFFYAPGPSDPAQPVMARQSLSYLSLYLYTRYHLSDKISLSGAVRTQLKSNRKQAPASYQFSIRIKEKQHKFILGIGQYSSHYVPDMAYTETLKNLKSFQVSLDYLYSLEKLKLKAGIYYKEEKGEQIGQTRRITGLDAAVEGRITDKLSMTLSYSGILAKSKGILGSYKDRQSLDYFIKAKLTYRITDKTQMSLMHTMRPGLLYTPVVGAEKLSRGYRPLFDDTLNSKRHSHYRTTSLTLTTKLSLGQLSPVFFASISNLFDKKNTRSFGYNRDYSDKQPVFYTRRTFAAGLAFTF